MNKLIHLSKKELDSIVRMMQTKEDTVCSISNQTLGSVFLPYGILGNVSNSKKIFQYGFGVVHIVQRRYEDNKLNESQITSFIILIYYIVKTQPLKLQVSTRFYVAFNGIKVIVDKNWYGNKEAGL